MPKNTPPVLLWVLALLVVMTWHGALAQSDQCPPDPALLARTDPAYGDAIEVADELRAHGFIIRCIFPSKLGSIFQIEEGGVLRSTIEGNAVFRSNLGDIEVVFMPKPQTFQGFRVTEHAARDGWWYSFGGTPRVWKANHFGSVRRTYFMKRGNQLFVLGEGELRLRLIKELNLSSSPPKGEFLPGYPHLPRTHEPC